jgi:hypothetical protein
MLDRAGTENPNLREIRRFKTKRAMANVTKEAAAQRAQVFSPEIVHPVGTCHASKHLLSRAKLLSAENEGVPFKH